VDSKPPFNPLTRRRFNWRMVRTLFALPAGELALQATARAQSGLPALGNQGDLTAAQERKLGDLIVRDLYRDPDYVDDPIIGEYASGIWHRLRVAGRELGEITPDLDESFAWKLLLGRDKDVNAFALPGGYMGLLMGMVGVVSSRAELASVMGHETGHIVQRHIARMLGEQGRQTPLMIAALLLGAVAASRNPQAGAAIAAGGQAAIIRQQLVFSRSMEREADRIGYGLMTQAHYAPQGFVSMFEKLEAASRLNDNGDWPFLRTHPLTSERIADVQLREQNIPHTQPPTDWETLLLAARARVLGRPGVDVLRQWAGEPDQPGFAAQSALRQAPALYAAALAHTELRNPTRAQALAGQLEQAMGAHPRALHQARMLRAELALRADQPQQALTILPATDPAARGDTNPRGQDGRALLLMRSEAQIRAGHGADAASALQPWVSDHPTDAGAWAKLAQALQAQGQMLRALRAEGEVQMARLDFAGAIDRWRAAQDYSRQHQSSPADLIEASIVDSRMHAAQDALREQKREEKKWS
jgi:predicted Zn-dependent protease